MLPQPTQSHMDPAVRGSNRSHVKKLEIAMSYLHTGCSPVWADPPRNTWANIGYDPAWKTVRNHWQYPPSRSLLSNARATRNFDMYNCACWSGSSRLDYNYCDKLPYIIHTRRTSMLVFPIFWGISMLVSIYEFGRGVPPFPFVNKTCTCSIREVVPLLLWCFSC